MSKLKKYSILMALLLLIVSFIGSGNRELHIENLDINAVIQPNGDIKVTETFDYKFSGKFNGVFRSYKLSQCDGYIIDKVTITDKYGRTTVAKEDSSGDDNTYEALYNNTYVKIYTPSKNERKTITTEYTILKGAKKYSDCGALYWNFYDVPEESVVKNGELRVSLLNDTYDESVLFYKAYGDGIIKPSRTDNVIDIKFRKLTSLIGVQIKFQRDFLNSSSKELSYAFPEQRGFVGNTKSDSMSFFDYILRYIVMFIVWAIIYYICEFVKAVRKKIFKKKVAKYRRKLNSSFNLNSNIGYVYSPPSDIPPACISFVYNDGDSSKCGIIDSMLYLANKGVYNITRDGSDIIFRYTGRDNSIKDKHLKFLIKWMNKYDKGSGININKIHKELEKEKHASDYVKNKKSFNALIMEDANKNKLMKYIMGKYIVSNEFYYEWEKWEKYRVYLIEENIDNIETIDCNIQLHLVYGISLGLTHKEVMRVIKSMRIILENAQEFEEMMRHMVANMNLIANNFVYYNKQEKRAFHTVYSSSSSGSSYGGVSSGSSFSGGGGGTSGGF